MSATATQTTVTVNKSPVPVSIKQTDHDDEETIDIQLAYMVRDPRHKEEKPYTLNYDTNGALPSSNITNEAHPAVVHNFRPLQNEHSFTDYGFTCAKFDCKVRGEEFNDTTIVERDYYPAVRKVLWDMFPDASDVRILEHSVSIRLSSSNV